MISRRGALQSALVVTGLGAAGLAAQRAGVLDDALRGVGAKPHRAPDPRDVELLAAAARGQADLLALLDATASDTDLRPLRAVLAEQLAAVDKGGQALSGTTANPDRPDLDRLATELRAAADARAADALAAGSLDVTTVLGTMAAGLDQAAVFVGRMS